MGVPLPGNELFDRANRAELGDTGSSQGNRGKGELLKGLLSLVAVALLVWWVADSPQEAAAAAQQGLTMLRQAAESLKTFLDTVA